MHNPQLPKSDRPASTAGSANSPALTRSALHCTNFFHRKRTVLRMGLVCSWEMGPTIPSAPERHQPLPKVEAQEVAEECKAGTRDGPTPLSAPPPWMRISISWGLEEEEACCQRVSGTGLLLELPAMCCHIHAEPPLPRPVAEVFKEMAGEQPTKLWTLCILDIASWDNFSVA